MPNETPTQPPPPQFAPPPPPPPYNPQPQQRRAKRTVALVAAGSLGAVVALGVGGTAGWVAGRHSADSSPAAASSGEAPTTDSEEPTAPGGGDLPDMGTMPDLGQGRTSDGTSGGTSASQTDATDEQEVGVVLIESTLSNGSGAGTGFVLEEDGVVVTNYHVVEGSTELQVTVASSGAVYDAEVVGSNATADIAVLQLTGADDLEEVALDDDGVEVGEAVTTIGNSEGQGYLSAASGEVLGLDEAITTSDQLTGSSNDLAGLIVNDVYAVSGDSGGPLVDAEGEVVGVTTATTSGGETRSYAVPIDDALAIVETVESGIETAGTRIGPNAYLGVSISDASAGGVTVAEVTEGGPAAEAGLASGDTITAFDGAAVASVDDLTSAVADHEPGESATVTWADSAGDEHTATLTLGESPLA